MFLQILLKVSVASANTTSPINFKFGLLITGTVFHFTRQIDIPDIKELGIHIVIQGLFAAHQFIYMIQIDLMKGLPVFNQRTDEPIDPCNIIFVRHNTGSGFRNSMVCPLVCICRIINTF